MMNSKLRYTSSNIVEIIVVILILAVVNYIGYKFFHRIDMTENKEFTISQATKDVLASLDDPVSVELFMSRDLPPVLAPLRDDVTDRLAEYVAYSKGNFKLKVTDPGDDEEEKQRAGQDGVRENQIQVTRHDELSVQNVYFGLVMKFEDKSEVISLNELSNVGSLEYGLTSKLVKLTQERKPKVGLFAGTFNPGGQQQQQQGPTYDLIRQVMSGPDGMYEVVQVDPQADKVLPADLDGLIIAGAFGMSDDMKYSVDQFIMNGGQVMVAIDPMMQMQGQGGQSQAFASLPTLEDQLVRYGVRFNKQLVADLAYSGQASIPTGMMTIIRDYFLWPEIVSSGFNQDVGAVSQLESLVMPWCCPLTEVVIEGVDYKPVGTTSEKSFTTEQFELNPDQDWYLLQAEAPATGPFDIAVMLEGQIPSAFPDGPPVKEAAAEGDVPPMTMNPEFDPAAHVGESKGLGRVVVMSSAMAISDGFMQRFNQNALYLLNMMDMMLMGEELLGIRSTPVTKRPLKDLSNAQQGFYRWMNILGVPVLLILFGGLLWFLKIKRRQAIAQRYGG